MEAREADLEPPGGIDAEALPEGWREQLAFRYGHAAEPRARSSRRSSPELAAPIVAGHPDLLAEVAVAARHEQARSLDDVLLRRTRLALVAAPQLRDRPRRSTAAAEVLGAELGWDRDRIERRGRRHGRTRSPRPARPGRTRRRESTADRRRCATGLIHAAADILRRRMASTLEAPHLSDLHRLAADLGIERYRMLGRDELVAAITRARSRAAAAESPGRSRPAMPVDAA